MIAHWLLATGHALKVALHCLYLAWPYIVSLLAIASTIVAVGAIKDHIKAEARIERLKSELFAARHGEHQVFARELREMRAVAIEYQQRYDALRAICDAEHVQRPLPTIPLDNIKARELEEELPF